MVCSAERVQAYLKAMSVKVLILLALLGNAKAQSHTDSLWVEIGVNGLTCTVCSRAVELSIRKLDFVSGVEMDLENTEGKVMIKPGTEVDFEKVATAVEEAGFSVRFFHVILDPGNWKSAGGCIWSDYACFFLLDKKGDVMPGKAKFKFIGKKFMPRSELKKNKDIPTGGCCGQNTKTYYVTRL